MDPITIAASVIAVLTPLAKKASEEFAGKAGEAVFEKAKGLLAKLKTKFQGDQYAEGTLTRFEKEPEKYASILEDALKEKLDENTSFKDELAQLIQEIKTAGPTVKVVMKMKKAEEATGAIIKKMRRGKVDLRQEIEEGKKITGVDIDELG